MKRFLRMLDEAFMSWRVGVPVREIPDFVTYLDTKRRAKRVKE